MIIKSIENNLLKVENLFLWQWREAFWAQMLGTNEKLIHTWKRHNRRAKKKRY
jgi:hypothetical protein